MVDSAQHSVQELKAVKAHSEQALAAAQHELANRDADEAHRLQDLKYSSFRRRYMTSVMSCACS